MIKGLVSIITPCYNGARYISETINSVLAQTYENWEMIIIDDGSVDNSAEIVAEFCKISDKIRYVKQENAGSAAARNNGISLAEGQYIALLDADDLWEPEFLATQIEFMKEKNAICVCCSYRCIDENSNEILQPWICKPVITMKEMQYTSAIGCLTGLYDCEKHGKIYLKEELKSLRDDFAYWIDIIRLEGVAYGNPQILARYRVLQNSVTGNKRKLIGKQYKFYRTYLKHGVIKSCYNLVRWGLMGLKKYKRF